MKTKTYILTLSTHFPKGHPREGQETNFADKARHAVFNATRARQCIYGGQLKLHTIRADYELWKRRFDEVNAGRAVLSVREWLGAPRRSKQRELFRLDRDSGIGVERLEWGQEGSNALVVHNEGIGIGFADWFVPVRDSELAANDGLTLEDWEAWFRDCVRSQPMAVIHFTNFRYCKLKEGSLPL